MTEAWELIGVPHLMNFTNINDSVGVKALLDQLRVSQAWQDALALQMNDSSLPPSGLATKQPDPPAVSDSLAHMQNIASSSTLELPSVSTLLSQLQSASDGLDRGALNRKLPSSFDSDSTPIRAPLAAQAPSEPKSLTFSQALPRIAQLCEDPNFVKSIVQLKNEQDKLERQIWEERRDIYKKYEEKVVVATNKAKMLGVSGVSRHEANMLQDGLKKDLFKFDRDRVLIAWDGLISKQQATLANLSVPTMFLSSTFEDRGRQQQVVQVLEGILKT